MLIAALAVLSSTRNVDYFSKVLSMRQAEVSQEHIVAVSAAVTPRTASRTTHSLDIVRGKRAHLTIDSDFRPYDEIAYFVLGENPSATVYRPDLGQYIKQDYPQIKTFAEMVRTATPSYDSFLGALLDPNGMKDFLAAFRAAGKWTETSGIGKPIKLNYVEGFNIMELTMDGKSGRLVRALIANDQGRVEWTMRYSPLKNRPNPADVKGAFEVKNFNETLAKPNAPINRNEAMMKIFERHEKDQVFAYSISDDGVRTRIYSGPGVVGQDDGQINWIYSNGILTLQNRTIKTVFRGKASASQAIDAVANAGSRVDPILRDVMLEVNPFRGMLEQGGSSVTTVRQGSKFVTTAKVDTVTFRITSQADGTVLDINTVIRDVDGALLTQSNRELTPDSSWRPGVKGTQSAKPINQLFSPEE